MQKRKKSTKKTRDPGRASNSGAIRHPSVAPEGLESEVRRVIADEGAVKAIQHVVRRTGWGLRESKDYVDQYRTPGADDSGISPEERARIGDLVTYFLEQQGYKVLDKKEGEKE